MTDRIKLAKNKYLYARPAICYERAKIWTESHRQTEGENVAVRRAKAFKLACEQLSPDIYEGELIVGVPGSSRKTGILTPEFSWQWVDDEMDTFENRPQDPYYITDEQKDYIRKNIFPYWKGKSLEECFLKRLPRDTANLLVDTGIIESDYKWRQSVGEVTPDYKDILFKKGYRKIIEEAKEKVKDIEMTTDENIDKVNFYNSIILAAEGMITLAKRYSKKLMELSETETNEERKKELLEMSVICNNVPENPPETFFEAIQFIWFVQLGGIISENPLALNLGRFDQYMYPYYKKDLEKGIIDKEKAEELIECLWIKLSEWVWTISSNTADVYAGYNQFQNLTVGGKKRDGTDGTNDITYMCLEATKRVRTHQPGLSVKIHPDCPDDFIMAVADLVSEGMGFPAIHNDNAGYQMMLQAGLDPEDARDWSNVGCVVPHFRKTSQWTSAADINLVSAFEYAINKGKSRLTGEQMGLEEGSSFADFDQVKAAYYRQTDYLIKHSVIGTVIAQKLHIEMAPRPFLSTCIDGCMEKGLDLSRGGGIYNVGPVLTGIGLAVVANSLAVIKKLVFEDKIVSFEELNDALNNDWAGYDNLRSKALEVPKYGNDDEYVDSIAIEISDSFYREVKEYKDLFGLKFNTAFMGTTNYIPAGRVAGATPCGRYARQATSEGISPFAGTDTSGPLASMRSVAKINHEVHIGGTLLNLRISPEIVKTTRGKRNLCSMIRAYFELGAFHVQFNTVSSDTLKEAQKNPEEYRDLLVRVAGYSTQFHNLSKEVQDAIIARTEHAC